MALESGHCRSGARSSGAYRRVTPRDEGRGRGSTRTPASREKGLGGDRNGPEDHERGKLVFVASRTDLDDLAVAHDVIVRPSDDVRVHVMPDNGLGLFAGRGLDHDKRFLSHVAGEAGFPFHAGFSIESEVLTGLRVRHAGSAHKARRRLAPGAFSYSGESWMILCASSPATRFS